MKEKGGKCPSSSPRTPWPTPFLNWRFRLLTFLVLAGMVVVWSIDGCTIKGLLEAWRSCQDFGTMKVSHGVSQKNSSHIGFNQIQNQPNSTQLSSNFVFENDFNSTQLQPVSDQNSSFVLEEKQPETEIFLPVSYSWIGVDLEPNLTSNLLARWLTPSGFAEAGFPGNGDELFEKLCHDLAGK